MRYNALLDSLQNLINYRPSQKELGEALGLAQTSISGRANRNSNFTDEEIAQIEKAYNVVIDGLKSDNKSIILDYYPDVFGSCGTGYFVSSEEKEQIQVPVNALFHKLSKGKKYSVINAQGNSMSPYIESGDKLIIEHNEGEPIIDNRVYVFCYDNDLYIKRFKFLL